MKISAINGYKPVYHITLKNNKKNNNNANSTKVPVPIESAGFYNINFTGSESSVYKRKFDYIESCFTPEAKSIYLASRAFARHVGSKEVEPWHVYAVSLLSARKNLLDIESGKIAYDDTPTKKLPLGLQDTITKASHTFEDSEKRKKIIEVIEKHYNNLVDNFGNDDKRAASSLFTPQPSHRLIDDLEYAHSYCKNIAQIESDTFYDSFFIVSAATSRDKKLSDEMESLIYDMRTAVMVDDSDKKQKNHLSIYDDKADAIWKNINMDKNSICVYDNYNPKSADHLVSSFVNLINKPDQKYRNIDPAKTDIIVLNKEVTPDYMEQLVKELKRSPNAKGRRTIIVSNMYNILVNCGGQVDAGEYKAIDTANVKDLKDRKINFVYTINETSYYSNTEKEAPFRPIISACATQRIPSLTAGDAVKYLTDDAGLKYIKSNTGKEINSEVVRKAIELTVQDEGSYPDKAVQLLKDVSEYYSDKEEITSGDVEHYVEENKAIDDSGAADKEINIVFDTGKTLKDVVGTPMTKAYAKSIVKQIENGIGVKGFTVYNANGTAYGGGRKHIAEAIAGETGIPMIKINAKDFALKDIDALSQNADFSEIKMKKIIATAKAQAQANPNKTAMIYIENFDNFASDPLYGISSIYEQKAFTQLLSEMEKARQNDDINLVIMGSMNKPWLLDENIMKPDKFLNEVVVYSPGDLAERKNLIKYYIDKKGLSIEGSKEEQEKIINYVGKTTKGFSAVDIMQFLDIAKSVAAEREHEKIQKDDLTEAYLQSTTGIANTGYLPEEYKKVVTTHEAGHAIDMVIMEEVAKKSNNKMHLPDVFNFITLDPRGYYGGATFFTKNEENGEMNFETGMADIIFTYGGNSAEDIIYGQNGSYGITGDMHAAERTAETMVTKMGIGPRTGVRKIPVRPDGSYNVSNKKFENIEEDIDSFLNTGKKISDMIIKEYGGFLEEFTEKYYKKVGTGECIIPAEDFIKELNDWRERQPEDKKARFAKLEHDIEFNMNRAKKGEDPK